MGVHIKTEGWHNWSKPEAEQTVFYAEFGSTGAGASNKRVPWATKLTMEQAKKFQSGNLLKQ